MIFFSKLITALFLPPGCIILFLLLIILFIPRRYKILAGIVTVLMYLISIQPVADFLLYPLEDQYPPLAIDTPNKNVEAIVVLGGGTIIGSPEAGSGRDTLSSDAVKRAVYAFSLRDVFPVPYVFSGGKVFDYDQETEALAASRLFASMGLSHERLIMEGESRNTWENAEETVKLGYNTVILVTSAYHMPRSVYCFKKNGISVIPAPTDYKIHRSFKHDFFSFMPSMYYMNAAYLALHEYLGLIYYYIIY